MNCQSQSDGFLTYNPDLGKTQDLREEGGWEVVTVTDDNEERRECPSEDGK
jgi:hypothetical protein